MAEAIRLFHIPPDAALEHLGGGKFHVKHADGRVEFIEVFRNMMPTVERVVFDAEPTMEWGGDDAA